MRKNVVGGQGSCRLEDVRGNAACLGGLWRESEKWRVKHGKKGAEALDRRREAYRAPGALRIPAELHHPADRALIAAKAAREDGAAEWVARVKARKAAKR